MRRATLTVAVMALTGSLLAAGQGRGGGGLPGGRGGFPPASEPQRPSEPEPDRRDDQPVFRGGVTLVQIDAIVTNAQGNTVTGLTAEDFEVLEAGEPRAITTFAAVNIPIAADLRTVSDHEPDVATNSAPQGRRYLIALDEVSPARVHLARNFVRKFITEQLGPNDVAAVALTGRGLATSGQDFTSNRRLLLAAVDKFTGGFEESTGNTDQQGGPARINAQGEGPTQGPGIDRAFSSDARQLASSLRRLTEFLATLPGRKSLLYVGEGLGSLDFFAIKDYHGESLTPAGNDAHAAIVAATRGNVTIYPVDPRGLTTDLTPAVGAPGGSAGQTRKSDILENRADMTALADVTGGFAIMNTNNIGEAFSRVVAENSSYYTLGFNSERTRRDGRFVRVEVRVKRPGLQVRSRDGYVAPLGEERRPAAPAADTRLRSVADALASPVSTRGVPIRVFAAPFKAARDKATVALALEFDGAPLYPPSGSAPSQIEISYVATDSRGAGKGGRRHTATISRPVNASSQSWVRILSEIELSPGRYQLRVAAGSAFNAGSVVTDLEVPDFTKGPLVLSGVALTSAATSRVTTLRPHDPLAGVLPAAPTAAREFEGMEPIALFAEVYDNRRPARDQPLPAIEVTASVLTDMGRVIRTVSAEPRSATTRKSGGQGFTLTVPLDLPPGDFVLAVDARAGADATSRRIPIRLR